MPPLYSKSLDSVTCICLFIYSQQIFIEHLPRGRHKVVTNTVSTPKELTVFWGKVEIKYIITSVMKENEGGDRIMYKESNLSEASGNAFWKEWQLSNRQRKQCFTHHGTDPFLERREMNGFCCPTSKVHGEDFRREGGNNYMRQLRKGSGQAREQSRTQLETLIASREWFPLRFDIWGNKWPVLDSFFWAPCSQPSSQWPCHKQRSRWVDFAFMR